MSLPLDSKPIFFILQAHDANKMVNNEGMTCYAMRLFFFLLKKQKTEQIQTVKHFKTIRVQYICMLLGSA